MIWFLALIFTGLILAYRKNSLISATVILAVFFGLYALFSNPSGLSFWFWLNLWLIFASLNITRLRQSLISQAIFKKLQHTLPKMSQTEQEALEAGNTWWDAELFSGQPNWSVLMDLPPTRLTEEEQAFIDGPVETLCEMLDDWEITHNLRDLPKEVWDYIKKHRFCGMIIPKQYGGLDFSNYAHSEIVMKLASRSSTAAVTVMVPNSLGPAKLLLSYGTESQKNHYLPRLATGEEIPCFALTGPDAGSDAGAMPDKGIVCYGKFEGQDKVLGIRLNWEKRYITLGPVATVIGLAFKLYDPDHLLGEKENNGITVALIPAKTPGVSIGKRHFPLDSAFQNGPNWGKDVFIPMDWIIGGAEQVGNGWRMLMQSLATGRAISLPALSVGASKFTCRNSGAYARIRKQFNLPIGEFEGIEEPLARMAGETYILDAARTVTAAALDQGEKPSVISAILKYELTERMRGVVNDGMDIQGGSGICLGPQNYLGRLYQVIPVSITVEGANILTRTMMIFGQGSVRCHPYIQKELLVLQGEANSALEQFDEVLFQHLGFVLHNLASSVWLGLTHARFLNTPGDHTTTRYYQHIARLSAGFSVVSDYALLILGGGLKRKERISGLFADALSNLYLCSTVLKHYHNQGCPGEDQPLLDWACQQTLHSTQQALTGIFDKLPIQPLVWILKVILFPLGKPYSPPNDTLVHKTAAILLSDSVTRDRLTQGIFINEIADDPTGRIELAFKAVLAAAPVEAKIKKAQRKKQLEKGDIKCSLEAAVKKKIISKQEAELITRAEQHRNTAIRVDAFDAEELLPKQK